MRVPYTLENPNRYLHYYKLQRGGDLPYYRGSVYQRGDGLGSIFGSIARFVTRLPGWVKSGASLLGRQAARTGMNMAHDMATNTDQWKQDWRGATKRHLKRAAGELLEEGGKRLQQGEGIKGSRKRRRKQKSSEVRKKRSSKVPSVKRRKNHQQRTKRDIFEVTRGTFIP